MELIKLKSKTLIEFFEKDTITAAELDEIRELDELNVSGNGERIDIQEAMLLQEDLSAFFRAMPDMMELRLDNIDMSNISIDKILKECSASEISFDGSEEYFSKLRNTKVNLSDLTRQDLSLDDKQEISEFDLFDILKANKQFSLLPVVDIDDLQTVLKYIDISDIRIKVRNIEDLKKVISLSDNKNIEIDIDINDFKKISEIDDNIKVNVVITDMSELTLDEVEELEERYNLNKITIYQPSNGKLIDDFGDANSINRERYDVDTYKQLRREIDFITSGIDLDSLEIEKFLEIYKRLGNKISYDWEHKDVDEENGTLLLGGYPPAHNLVGGLLNNTCVCEGYAKILKQALACVGVESKVILGNGKMEPHAWNQVKIDDTWYNTDLTWDADKIKEKRELDWCLQSDEEFIYHGEESIIREECKTSFNRNVINKYLEIPFAFEFEEKDYSTADIISLIRNLNSNSINGIRIGINRDFSTGDYKIGLGNIIDNDTVKWSESEISLTSRNLAEFIETYSKTFSIKDKDTKGVIDFIKTEENVELVVDESLKKSMQKYGVNIDELLSPRKENEINREDGENPIENDLILEENQIVENDNVLKQQENSLIEYKPSIWKKIVDSFKNGFKKFQTNLLKKKEIDKDIPNDDILGEVSSRMEKKEVLPSWDLKNWSEEELEECLEKAEKDKITKSNIKTEYEIYH